MLETRTRHYIALSVLENEAVSVITQAGTAMSFSPSLLADAPVRVHVSGQLHIHSTCLQI